MKLKWSPSGSVFPDRPRAQGICHLLFTFLFSLWHNACYIWDAQYIWYQAELKTCKMRLLTGRASSEWIPHLHFSNSDVHTNHLDRLLKCSFWSDWFGVEPRQSAFITSSQVMLMLLVRMPSATLWVARLVALQSHTTQGTCRSISLY